MVNTIWFRVDLVRFRKDFSVCGFLFQKWNVSTIYCTPYELLHLHAGILKRIALSLYLCQNTPAWKWINLLGLIWLFENVSCLRQNLSRCIYRRSLLCLNRQTYITAFCFTVDNTWCQFGYLFHSNYVEWIILNNFPFVLETVGIHWLK